MKRLTIILRKIWRILFFLNAGICFVFFYPFFYYYCTNEKRFQTGFRLKKFFARLILAMPGVRFTVQMEVPLDPNQVYVFCPNHTSYIDIVISYAVIPNYFHMMAKAELQHVPLFNVFFIAQDIPVDRGSLRGSHRAFLRCAEDIDKGISIVIFPEATIPDRTPRLGRFKNGAFRLAVDKNVAVVPVTYLDNWWLLPDGRKAKHGGLPGLAKIVFHKPIYPSGKSDDDVQKLRDETFRVIDAEMRKAESVE